MWTEILSYEQITAQFAKMSELDPGFARKSIDFWSTRTVRQLRSLKSGAWYSNQPEQFQLARSYLALSGEMA